MNEQENLGREGLSQAARRPSTVTTLVIGFSGNEGQNQSWLVTHSADLNINNPADRASIAQQLIDAYGLQADTAIYIADRHSDRPLVIGATDAGDEDSFAELFTNFVDIS